MLDALLWNLLLTAGLAVVLAALCHLPSIDRRPAFRHCLWLLLLCVPPVQAHNGAVAIAVPVEGITVDGDLSDWPEEMVMSPEVRERIDALWDELDIPLPERPRTWWDE